MGDRGNIVLHQKMGSIYFYTHWGGSSIRHVVQKALARRARWDDEPYLAHIIFDALEDEQGDHGSETGLGISLAPPDNEHPFVVVDAKGAEVREEDEVGRVLHRWTFEEYLTVDFEQMAEYEEIVETAVSEHLYASR